MDMPEPRLSRRLQRTLLAFFSWLRCCWWRSYVAAPSIYTNTLLLAPSPTQHSPAAAPLLLVGDWGFLALVMVGVLRRWRWVFWLVLVAFGAMILDVPATILQLTGILPEPVPALVQPVPDGRLPDRGRHCRVDAPASIGVMGCGRWEGRLHPAQTLLIQRFLA